MRPTNLTPRHRGSRGSIRAGGLRLLSVALCLAALGALVAGCTASREMTKSPRGAIEQLLLSQAIERSLFDLRIPILADAAVAMEIEGLPPDLAYVRTMVAEQLGLNRAQLRPGREGAKYVVRVIVHSLGTEQAEALFGMPEVQAGFFPIALPELAFYKEVRQKGYARLSVNVFDAADGKLVEAVPWRAGSAFYDFYTILFWFNYPATDLVLPPSPDSGFQHTIKRTTDVFTEEQDEGLTPTTPISP